MNTKEIGRKFEKECVGYLQKIFDEVVWLSDENENSIFDFKCKKDDQYFYGDAKFLSNGVNKPAVRHSQRDADFIIAQINGKIKFYIKGEIFDNCIMLPNSSLKNSLPNPFPNNPNVLQVKYSGFSKSITLPHTFVKFHDINVGDWLDLSDVCKVEKEVKNEN